MKVEKNYFRTELIALTQETGIQPIIFTGRYKHRDNPQWTTFTTIRRYVPGEKTKTVCSHININRDSVSRYLTLTEGEHDRLFYICGRVSTYEHYGKIRGCLVLAETGGESALWMTALLKSENEAMAQRILHLAQQVTALNAGAAGEL
jgi:hypothetical protein